MSLLLNTNNLSKSYSSKELFKNLSFSVFKRDKIGLIGPNGSGKSTLLKILAGLESSDEGEVVAKRSLKIVYVPQSVVYESKSVKDVLFDALKNEPLSESDKKLMVEKWLSKVGFEDFSRDASKLSGGWQKRLSIAASIILSPDLLLLDEPTNHLDLESLLWLENFLQKKVLNLIFVSHDRYFLQNVCNKIIEISKVYPKDSFVCEGTYLEFLKQKETFLAGQLQQEKSLNSKARREGEWLKQGVKARTTKSTSRINEAYEIFEQLSNLKKRNQSQKTQIDFISTDRGTKKLITLKSVSKSMGGKELFKNLSFMLSPKTRIGLIGSNGSGKTTLLKLIAEELIPDSGIIKKAENLKVVYFDQHRMQLDAELTLKEALCPSGEFVHFQKQKIHVNAWAQRFLFPKNILDLKIKNLSGGERARIAIAHLLLEPADVLLLDEPTNDLDIQTLETLEKSLLDFSGAIVLITHDRFLIDRVCNSIISLENKDQITVFSDYAQYEASRKPVFNPVKVKAKPLKKSNTSKKLTYAESKELKEIEKNLPQLEIERTKFNDLLTQTDVIQKQERLGEICKELAILENKIERLYIRWDELDKKA